MKGERLRSPDWSSRRFSGRKSMEGRQWVQIAAERSTDIGTLSCLTAIHCKASRTLLTTQHSECSSGAMLVWMARVCHALGFRSHQR